MIFYNSWIFRFFPKKFIGIMLFGMIFFREKEYFVTKTQITHEKIHIEQWLQFFYIWAGFSILLGATISFNLFWLLIATPFVYYVWYLVEYLIRLFQFKQDAYRNISFEREAYEKQYGWNKGDVSNWYDYL